MGEYTQDGRPMAVSSPAFPKDTLLLVGFTGHEAISQLYSFDLDLLAENATKVVFSDIIGAPITIRINLPGEKVRFFGGMCSRITQGERDATFTKYSMEIVPSVWLLTRRVQSRVFPPDTTVPDVLRKVFGGLNVDFKIENEAKLKPRDFLVQYRESDYNFAARLMEEEGLCYFFVHGDNALKMVITNAETNHPDVPEVSELIYEEVEGGVRDEDRISAWQKSQEMRSGLTTLWDHCFELPGKNLEAIEIALDQIAVGSVTHNLHPGQTDKLELYDFPGEYAQRFDGVDKAGQARPKELEKIFEDNSRTALIRMEEETVRSILVRGASSCRQLVSGHKFSLTRHFNADGKYLLTSVDHHAQYTTDFRSGGSPAFIYQNGFTCIPATLPFRPQRRTPKPVIQGTQTAVVVGPSGEEIFTDKYGRVKVQFHWDREGKKDPESSGWIRVGSPWAGRQWGMVHIPRIGHEVIVAFEEGDPDKPIIIGSVYNADLMPPYTLDANKTQSGIKSRSSPGGGTENFNEIRFEDKKGQESVTIHAEKDHNLTVENNQSDSVGADRSTSVGNNESLTVKKGNRTVTVQTGTNTETIKGNHTHIVQTGNSVVSVQTGTHNHYVKGAVREDYLATQTTVVAGDILIGSANGMITVDAKTELKLICGDSLVHLKADGTINISGKNVSVTGSEQVKAGVGNQNVICDKTKVGVSGASINSTAVGTHEIAGGVVKIN